MSAGILSSDITSNDPSPNNSFSSQAPAIKFPLSEDRGAHERDKTCTTCSCNYNVPGLSHTRKFFCHFCYRGHCSRCLTFEYYHSEQKSHKPMCSGCHSRLLAMSDQFLNEIHECRLERMQLKKEIKLAEQEKKHYERERQIKSEELTEIKKSMTFVGKQELEVLEQLKTHKKDLKEQVKDGKSTVETTEYMMRKLNKEFDRKKNDLEKLKKEKKVEKEKCKELTEKLHEYELKNAALNRDKNGEITEETRINNIHELNEDIEKYERRIKRKNRKNEGLIEELHELKENIRKNNARIEDVQEIIENMKSDDPEKLTEEENQRLKDLEKQLKQLKDVIKLEEQRLESKKSPPKKIHSLSIGSYQTSSDLHHGNKSSSQTSHKKSDDQEGCCKSCLIQ